MLLLRHASAGEKLDFPALDRARPLDRQGRADARSLSAALAGHRFERIVSSPHRRCVESVEPIAAARGVALELRRELEPDASVDQTRALLARLSDETLVCTHREVFERLFHGEVACEKGGAWKVERVRSRLLPVEYFGAPSKRAARATRLVRSR
jgi:phosphohistidine phosphatase SixA